MRKFEPNMQQPIRALLVDDELPACETLAWLLKEYCPEVNVQGMVHSASEARSFLNNNSADVLFLDISMPVENGFDLLHSLPENKYPVIFITAHDEYAIKAFRDSAIDYLLKPVDGEELKQAMEKIKMRLKNSNDPLYDNAIEKLIQTFSSQGKGNKIAISHAEGIHFILTNDIVYLEADSNYTIFHLLNGGKIVASKTMGEFEPQLTQNFFRIHKSFNINLRHVSEYVKKEGNSVLMTDGALLPVSRRKNEELVQALLIN